MNFEHGTELAKYQDSLFVKLTNGFQELIFNREHLRRLEGNLWVRMAEKSSPNNLVVRHLCLTDILNARPENQERIERLLGKLAPSPKIWAEGYSYWEYTRGILKYWVDNFKDTYRVARVKCAMRDIDANFALTSYMRDGKKYPAPFGDLRDVPLRHELQGDEQEPQFRGEFLTKHGDRYFIKPYLLGGNTHTPARNEVFAIVGGRPAGFHFYTGYDKKYQSAKREWADIGWRFVRKLFNK